VEEKFAPDTASPVTIGPGVTLPDAEIAFVRKVNILGALPNPPATAKSLPGMTVAKLPSGVVAADTIEARAMLGATARTAQVVRRTGK